MTGCFLLVCKGKSEARTHTHTHTAYFLRGHKLWLIHDTSTDDNET